MSTFLNKAEATTTGTSNETIIGEAVRIDGTFTGSGNVTVYGVVEGQLTTSGDLIVADSAKIEAEIEAHNISVSGEVHGNIHANGKLELQASARVYGDVVAEVLSVQTGAVLQGTCTTGQPGSTAAKNASQESSNDSEE